ncbi:MAG: peptide-binding protein, partial [Pseudomonadota bacterium]
DVASDDTLNVRAEPSAASADIGDLPHNATRIEVAESDATGKWGRIVWEEGNGWIAMRFLAPESVPTIGASALPAGLVCAGTEPFWSMTFSEGSASFSDISGAFHAFGLQGSRVAEGRPGYPLQIGLSGADAAATTLIRPAACSDGMSDRLYPWSVDLILQTEAGGRYMVGCCQLPLDYGFH